MSTFSDYHSPEVNPAGMPDYEPDFCPARWEKEHTRTVRHACGHDCEWIYRYPEQIPATSPEPCPRCEPCLICRQPARECRCDPFEG